MNSSSELNPDYSDPDSSDSLKPSTPEPMQPRPGERLVNSRLLMALQRSRRSSTPDHFRKPH